MRLRLVMETADGAELRQDQPGGGVAFGHRRFLPRAVATTFVTLGDGVPIEEGRDD
jgi:hypothetical protein